MPTRTSTDDSYICLIIDNVYKWYHCPCLDDDDDSKENRKKEHFTYSNFSSSGRGLAARSSEWMNEGIKGICSVTSKRHTLFVCREMHGKCASVVFPLSLSPSLSLCFSFFFLLLMNRRTNGTSFLSMFLSSHLHSASPPRLSCSENEKRRQARTRWLLSLSSARVDTSSQLYNWMSLDGRHIRQICSKTITPIVDEIWSSFIEWHLGKLINLS